MVKRLQSKSIFCKKIRGYLNKSDIKKEKEVEIQMESGI